MIKNAENELEMLRKKAADLESKLAAQDIEIGRYQEAEQRHQEFVERHQLIENELQARLKKKESDFDRVVQQLMEARRQRFGRKSERFVDDENPQVPLFPVEFDDSTPNPDSEDIELVTYKRKKSGGRRPLDLSGLPHREEIVPVDDKDRICSCCGTEKKHAGFQSSSRLHVIPARFEVVTEKREKLACPKGCEGQCVTAPLPLGVLPKSIASESLAAHIIVSKVLDRQPLYHLEKVMEQRFHFKIGRNMMARWMIMIADQLQPLINLMKDQIEAYDIAAIDATGFTFSTNRVERPRPRVTPSVFAVGRRTNG